MLWLATEKTTRTNTNRNCKFSVRFMYGPKAKMSLCAKMSHIFNFNSVPSVEVGKSYLRDFGSPWDIAFSDIVAQHWVPQERGLSLRSTVAGLMGGDRNVPRMP